MKRRIVWFIIIVLLVIIIGQSEVGSANTDQAAGISYVNSWYGLNSKYQDDYKPSYTAQNLSSLASTLSDPTCTDSDGGQDIFAAGYVQGIGPNGWPYTKYDTCETGDYEGYLREYFCIDTLFSARRFNCSNGCFDGACYSAPPTCTDNDEDTYAIEGGTCGLIDCDDNNPQVNPGAVEDCQNGIDDNCDGLIDSQDPGCLICTDLDSDGYALEGDACGPIDCDDTNPNINPGASEVCGNGLDDNCNGKVDADDPACGATQNVIVIGWDGVQRDHLMDCYNQVLPECTNGLPNLAAIGDGVIYDLTVTNGDTATKPGWAQILSGYNAEVTGVYSNGLYQPIPEGYSIFEKIENYVGMENIVTMFISGKSEHTGGACIGDPTFKNGLPVMEDLGQPWCLTKFHLDYYENDLRQNSVVGNRAMELLEIHQNDLFFAFFLFRDPDVTGHVAGEDSYHYSNAIINVDWWLGEIVAKINELGMQDHTLIYVVSDHGFDEGSYRHGNAPYTFFATNDNQVMREGDRKDVAPTILERYGIGLGAIGDIPAVDGNSLYAIPTYTCVEENQAQIDYLEAPICCSDLNWISLDKVVGSLLLPATGGTGDDSGYCTYCGDGMCVAPENYLNCPVECTVCGDGRCMPPENALFCPADCN